MHGRPRQAPSAATDEERAKIVQYNKHKNAALAAYKSKLFTPATFALTTAILKLNPDLYTLFNYRKEQVIHKLLQPEQDSPTIWATELQLSANALKKQPKSYQAWHHRIWCLNKGKGHIDVKCEFDLTDMFLKADNRNFHCWNYRRVISRIAMGIYEEPELSPIELKNEQQVIRAIYNQQQQQQQQQKQEDTSISNMNEEPTSHQLPIPPAFPSPWLLPEDELHFTEQQIALDFSNYSAWHYRSILLPIVLLRKCYHFYSIPSSLDCIPSDDIPRLFGLSSDLITSHIEPFLQCISSITKENWTTTPKETYSQYVLAVVKLYVAAELELIHNAIVMSPNDQSPWLYQRYLLSTIQQLISPSATASEALDGHHSTGSRAIGLSLLSEQLALFTPDVAVSNHFSGLLEINTTIAPSLTSSMAYSIENVVSLVFTDVEIQSLPPTIDRGGLHLPQSATTQNGRPSLPILFACLSCVHPSFFLSCSHYQLDILAQEYRFIYEMLLPLEPNSKNIHLSFPIIHLVILQLSTTMTRFVAAQRDLTNPNPKAPAEDISSLEDEITKVKHVISDLISPRQCIDRLIEIDPYRIEYYRNIQQHISNLHDM